MKFKCEYCHKEFVKENGMVRHIEKTCKVVKKNDNGLDRKNVKYVKDTKKKKTRQHEFIKGRPYKVVKGLPYKVPREFSRRYVNERYGEAVKLIPRDVVKVRPCKVAKVRPYKVMKKKKDVHDHDELQRLREQNAKMTTKISDRDIADHNISYFDDNYMNDDDVDNGAMHNNVVSFNDGYMNNKYTNNGYTRNEYTNNECINNGGVINKTVNNNIVVFLFKKEDISEEDAYVIVKSIMDGFDSPIELKDAGSFVPNYSDRLTYAFKV